MLGAQILVDFLEIEVFGNLINPAVRTFTVSMLKVAFLEEMLVGPYGLITMGLAWALALVLPVVLTFFSCFFDLGGFRLYSAAFRHGRPTVPQDRTKWKGRSPNGTGIGL